MSNKVFLHSFTTRGQTLLLEVECFPFKIEFVLIMLISLSCQVVSKRSNCKFLLIRRKKRRFYCTACRIKEICDIVLLQLWNIAAALLDGNCTFHICELFNKNCTFHICRLPDLKHVVLIGNERKPLVLWIIISFFQFNLIPLKVWFVFENSWKVFEVEMICRGTMLFSELTSSASNEEVRKIGSIQNKLQFDDSINIQFTSVCLTWISYLFI